MRKCKAFETIKQISRFLLIIINTKMYECAAKCLSSLRATAQYRAPFFRSDTERMMLDFNTHHTTVRSPT